MSNSQMSDELLSSLGFILKPSPHGDKNDKYWTHERGNGKFYYHILTPDMVVEALIEIGHEEFRKAAIESLTHKDMNDGWQ